VLHQFTGVLALTAALIATQRAGATVAQVPVRRTIGERQTADGRNYSTQTGVVR
jgi:hypothetical protein